MENLISKLKEKFNLVYLIYCGAMLTYNLCNVIYEATNNYTTMSVIQAVVSCLLDVALFGLGLYFIFKKDEEKFKKLFLLFIACAVINYYGYFAYAFQTWFYKNEEAYYVIRGILNIFDYVICGVFGAAFISYLLFKKDLWKKITNYSLVAMIGLYVVFFIVDFVGTCMGKCEWIYIISVLSATVYYVLILLGINKYYFSEN